MENFSLQGATQVPPPYNGTMKTIGETSCEICGQRIMKLLRADRHMYCTECAMNVIVEAARAMAAKSGPVYDRWRNNPGGCRNDRQPRKGR